MHLQYMCLCVRGKPYKCNSPRCRQMGRIDVILEDDFEKKFREMVFKRYGMKRGNMTEAIREALQLWMIQEKEKVRHSRAAS
jgi:Arc/MetJ-type ribon-helix-helix transcriptional regulator